MQLRENRVTGLYALEKVRLDNGLAILKQIVKHNVLKSMQELKVKPYTEEEIKVLQEIEDKMWYGTIKKKNDI